MCAPVVLALAVFAISALAACAPPPSGAYRLTFPVQGGADYSDSFGGIRSGGRAHAGQDLMAPKMRPVVAAMAGRITWLRHANGSSSGNMLTITAPDGWSTTYIHLNNDTPGTDDGRATREQVFAPGIVLGATVSAGQLISWVGDSGNAESKSPHLHFELHRPGGAAVNAYPSLRAAPIL
ncbi:MAG TPA: M23 family metallopeptidase [Microthrixaceae bacterium]|nr:M23 family metallopeptidase [Microthrixaceae bacterium]